MCDIHVLYAHVQIYSFVVCVCVCMHEEAMNCVVSSPDPLYGYMREEGLVNIVHNHTVG